MGSTRVGGISKVAALSDIDLPVAGAIQNRMNKDSTCHVTCCDTKVFRAINNHWAAAVRRVHMREFFAELVGTFVLILFGDATVAQVVTSDPILFAGGFLTINIGWGLGLVIALYVSIGVSGGHLNPAVTLAMALRGKLSWLKVIPYWIAQFLGAFMGAAVVYCVYFDAIDNYESARNLPDNVCDHNITAYKTLCTGGIFATYPRQFLSLASGFIDQVVGTFILVVGIFAICDSNNSEPQPGMKPLILGLLLWLIGMSFGFNCGYAINPARDLSPRVFTAIAGWGLDVFVCSQCSIRHWWWVPIIAPMLGAALAPFFYWFFIEAHHVREQPPTTRLSAVNIGYQPKETSV